MKSFVFEKKKKGRKKVEPDSPLLSCGWTYWVSASE
jgi:hypothetical protein